MLNPDLLIVGAGPVGCVVAELAASRLSWTSVIVEKRSHIGGNCFDRIDEHGVMIHQYGPHYFRTNSRAIVDYLSRFTDWIPGNYVVQSLVAGQLFPFPINLTTLERYFGCKLDIESANRLLEREREAIDKPKNSEEFVLSRVGRRLYEDFYLGYTLKQWDKHPQDLDVSVCGRVPVRLTRNEKYVDHEFQLMPKDGFTKMFSKMLAHPLIDVRLECDFKKNRSRFKPTRATVYTGPVDEYFDHRLGRLEWRSLAFEFEKHDREYQQSSVQINYPDANVPFTRTVEFKHITAQKSPHTVVCREYPKAEGDPYYPVPTPRNARLSADYAALAAQEKDVYFCGRLAQYRYLNTDEAIQAAFDTFELICSEKMNG